MNVTITVVKQNATAAQVAAVINKLRELGWQGEAHSTEQV